MAIKDPEMETEFSVPPPMPSTVIPNVVKFGRALVLLERLERESVIAAIPAFKQALKDLREIRGEIQNGSLPGMECEKAKAKGTEQEIVDYCVSMELEGVRQCLTTNDGHWFFEKMKGSGWKNGGKAVNCWKSTARSWCRIGIFPSQKQAQKNPSVKGPSHTTSQQLEGEIARLRRAK